MNLRKGSGREGLRLKMNINLTESAWTLGLNATSEIWVR